MKTLAVLGRTTAIISRVRTNRASEERCAPPSRARRDAHLAFTWQQLRNRTPVALKLGGGLTPEDVRMLTLASRCRSCRCRQLATFGPSVAAPRPTMPFADFCSVFSAGCPAPSITLNAQCTEQISRGKTRIQARNNANGAMKQAAPNYPSAAIAHVPRSVDTGAAAYNAGPARRSETRRPAASVLLAFSLSRGLRAGRCIDGTRRPPRSPQPI